MKVGDIFTNKSGKKYIVTDNAQIIQNGVISLSIYNFRELIDGKPSGFHLVDYKSNFGHNDNQWILPQ